MTRQIGLGVNLSEIQVVGAPSHLFMPRWTDGVMYLMVAAKIGLELALGEASPKAAMTC